MWLVVNFFFFNDTATTEIYTLSLHDALPISNHIRGIGAERRNLGAIEANVVQRRADHARLDPLVHLDLHQRAAGELRSEEHTSELQSRSDLVCRLLLEKKKNTTQSDLYTSSH